MASHKSLCGINITSSDISLVQFNPDDYTIENVAIQPIDSEDPDEWINIKGTLKRIIRETKIKGRKVSAAVPGEYAIIKKVMVDSSNLNPEEAINWEMEQYLLDSISDYYIANEFSGRSEDKTINYFIAVAYRKDTLKNIEGVLKDCKLKPVIIEPDVFSLINLLETNYKDVSGTPCVIVHSDGHYSGLILTKDGKFIDYEPFETEDDIDNDADFFIMELQKAVKRISNANTGVDSGGLNLYLTGGLFSNRNFTESVIAKVGNAELLNPFKEIQNTIELDDAALNKYIPKLSVPAGLILRDDF